METYLGDRADFSKIRRVLVIKLQHYGDVLLTTPVFAALKQRFPHLQIDVLVFADTAPLLAGNPHIDRIHCIERAGKKRGLSKLIYEIKLLKTLRARRYDLLIALTDRMRAAILARMLRPAYSVAQKYTHKRGAFWRNSFTHLYTIPSAPHPRHTVEINLDALRRLGFYPQSEEKNLLLVPSRETVAKVSALCAKFDLQEKKYLVLHPTSRWMFKSWNVPGFAALLRGLTASGLRVALVSGPDQAERDYVRAILQQVESGGIADFSGQLSLPELAALTAKARCFIGLDSVAMHIAAAVGTPCVALFGPSNERVWGPWNIAHRVVSSSHSCRPCNMDGCGNGKVSDCLQVIDSGEVIAAVTALLAEERH